MHVQQCDSPGLQEELEIRGSACTNLKIQYFMTKQDCYFIFYQATVVMSSEMVWVVVLSWEENTDCGPLMPGVGQGAAGGSLLQGFCPCLLPTGECGYLLVCSLETSKDWIDFHYHNALKGYFLSLKKTNALFISNLKKIHVKFIFILQTPGSIMSDENLFCHTCLSLN